MDHYHAFHELQLCYFFIQSNQNSMVVADHGLFALVLNLNKIPLRTCGLIHSGAHRTLLAKADFNYQTANNYS